MQAACMGLPLILTDINGCNELIKDKESGVLITPKNVESIIEAMKLVFHDEQLRITLALNSQKEIREKFREDLVWKNILYEYETLLRANKQ
jgi:glycosyltransferase involved in cell wall biosynthesis